MSINLSPTTLAALAAYIEQQDIIIHDCTGNPIPFDKWPETFQLAVCVDFFAAQGLYIDSDSQVFEHGFRIINDSYGMINDGYGLDTRHLATAAAIKAADEIISKK